MIDPALDSMFDDLSKPFKTDVIHKPIEGQLIYISTANMLDNPFIKKVKEYLAESTKENKNDNTGF